MDVLKSKQAVIDLSNQKLPIRGSYLVLRALKALEPEFQLIESKRADLIRELGVEKEGMIEVPPEKMNEFNSRFNAMLETSIEVAMDAIPLSSLGDIKMSALDLMVLEPLLKDDSNGN